MKKQKKLIAAILSVVLWNPSVTPEPTVTPNPSVTPEPTVTPSPTVTPKPTATPGPIKGEDTSEGPQVTPTKTPDSEGTPSTDSASQAQKEPVTTVKNAAAKKEGIKLDGALITNAVSKKAPLKVRVTNAAGTLYYMWNIPYATVSKDSKAITEDNWAVTAGSALKDSTVRQILKKDTQNSKGMTIQVSLTTDLSYAASLWMRTNTANGINPGSTVYVYKVEEKSGKLTAVSTAVVSKKGYVKMKVRTSGTYVILPNKADAKVLVP